MLIEQIKREHGYITCLLSILASKVNLLKQDKDVNYSLIKEIVDYLSEHAETVHHPKEDVLYHYYLHHYGSKQEMENLEFEHKLLECKTQAFLDVVNMILQDAIVPHRLFAKQLESFMVSQRQHLELEEQTILPMIMANFSAKDWQEVEKRCQPTSKSDPVFGHTQSKRYAQLAQRVRQTELECV